MNWLPIVKYIDTQAIYEKYGADGKPGLCKEVSDGTHGRKEVFYWEDSDIEHERLDEALSEGFETRGSITNKKKGLRLFKGSKKKWK